jgi:ribonuclease P protein subunit RPR2
MSKVKAPKSKGVPSKHLHARTTFLYQAATYLTLQTALDDSTASRLPKNTFKIAQMLRLSLSNSVRICNKSRAKHSSDFQWT